MKKSTLTVIAVIALLAVIVGVFAACKKNTNGSELVTVVTAEDGSLYYTDPTREVDGITYGGETHFVKPEETNKHGEYRVDPKNTSAPYTTDSEGNVAPVTKEPSTTAPDDTTTTKGNTDNTTTQGTDPTQSTSQTTTETTTEITTEELHGLDNADSNNNLNDDGVIQAW